MKNVVIGILAHVDAGKTTLSEGILYSAGAISRVGRVDKRDSFLDTDVIERERGITIFSKQAVFSYGDAFITLVDTPGHVDFACEAERALSVQDYAILVVSAPEGIQSHTKTLWQLLRARSVPTFIFVNKTDIADRCRAEIMDELRATLSHGCADFSTDSVTYEDSAAADEELMEEYFDTGTLSDASITDAIARCALFPCFFGSALKMQGVDDFLRSLVKYIRPSYASERFFGARVYKIGRDKQGKRLSYVKITGGTLCVKDAVKVKDRHGEIHEEKVEEIRIYSADKYKSVKVAVPGVVYALVGLSHTECGMGLGSEVSDERTLEAVLDYRMILPPSEDVHEAYLRLATLAEENPDLYLSYEDRTKEIRVRLMGDIQLEVLKRVIRDRFALDVDFSEGSVLYKETVRDEVYGRGHFEPLRHYAEVHLKIEPLPEGSGILTDVDCPTDFLALNWQRLILTHLEERVHRGVLTGSPLTDVKITLVAGKAHNKHTEGGDFRQATYRAVRQGLMKAVSVLLEPTYDFTITLGAQNVGKAMTDIENMGGTCLPPDIDGGSATLSGNCPVRTMRSYATRLRAYTRGEGKLTLRVGRYVPCRIADEIIAEIGYDATLDERNTPNSVFCKNGAGYVVPWYEADELMHVGADTDADGTPLHAGTVRAYKTEFKTSADEDKELMRIFEATYGKIKPRTVKEKTVNESTQRTKKPQTAKITKKHRHIVIDGYNFIFGWDFLHRYAAQDLALARDMLIRIMSNYISFYKCSATVVFDAYKRDEQQRREFCVNGVTVVYTREGQTADAYIEKITRELAANNEVRVVTGDRDEQMVVFGAGGLRVSTREFSAELEKLSEEINEIIESLK